MPRLKQTTGSESSRYSDHRIVGRIKNEYVTFQVLPAAMREIKKEFPGLNPWNLPDGGFELPIPLVVRLRCEGKLKTKKEIDLGLPVRC